jgi:glycosyltransferase involved in cell wall biosynthesis
MARADSRLAKGPYMKVALICDYPEEGWPSMDLVGEMIGAHLEPLGIDVTRICPEFHRRALWVPGLDPRFATNADRLINRMWDYPRHLKRIVNRGSIDLYHIVDHSYSQLVHALPAGRTVVTCHDLDTFRYVLEPDRHPRPAWFRAMIRRVMSGLAQAAAVACDSVATRDALAKLQLLPEERLHVVYLAVHPECSPLPDMEADERVTRWLGPVENAPMSLLHVGSNIDRKRIDVLLSVFAEVARARADVRLVKVGGELTSAQENQARELGIRERIVTLPPFDPKSPRDRAGLAAVYRRASVVLMPSEAEGVGLPVVEALACGVPVVATDMPVFREVGGEAITYCALGNVQAWVSAVLGVLSEGTEERATHRTRGLERAGLFTWRAHAERLAEIYRVVLGF